VGPAGDFTLPPNPGKLLFISGGSGVTPMLSMTRYLHDLAADIDIAFLHFARSPADLLFTAEIDALAGFWPALKPRFIVDDPAGSKWAGPVGRPSDALLRQLCPDLAGRDIFCCGPAPFMQAVRDSVTTIAGSLDRYREESFQPASPAPVESTATTDTAEIRFTQSGRNATITGAETILAAAQAAGIPIPYACEMGLCGTCQVKKISGEIVMNHDGGITDDAIAEGYILACCSRPASGTIEIEL
jgi:ferredoxin-NADP reductase